MIPVISSKSSIFDLSAQHTPAYIASPGDTLLFETKDCFSSQITREDQRLETLDWSCTNPATGPVYVRDAMPGDVLKVSILSIETGTFGVMAAIPKAGLFGDEVSESAIKVLPIENGQVTFRPGLSIPLQPMIGVIGVAPSVGAIGCGTPGSHGGNMDNRLIGTGSTLYLPVFHEGALLAMGDVHAAMGDGEVMVTGVETAARITVRVEVMKGSPLNNPLLETASHFYTIASAKDLGTAVHTAARDMADLVMKCMNMPFHEAGMLLSACGHTEICQVVDPLQTARFSMPKSVLESVF